MEFLLGILYMSFWPYLLLIGGGFWLLMLIIFEDIERDRNGLGKTFLFGVALWGGYLFLKPTYQFTWLQVASMVSAYVLIGCVYCFVEAKLLFEKETTALQVYWKTFLHGFSVMTKKPVGDKTTSIRSARRDIQREFENCMGSWANRSFIIPSLSNLNEYTSDEVPSTDFDKLPKPVLALTLNRLRFSNFLYVWITFWPFYLVDLVIGRGLRELSKFIAEHFGKVFANMLSSSAAGKFD